MSHLTDDLLNEVLDHALGGPRRGEIEAHLAACTDCQARLAALRGVSVALAGLAELPEEPMAHSLQAGVMAELNVPAPPRWLGPLVVAQAVAALGLLAAAWPPLAMAWPGSDLAPGAIRHAAAAWGGQWLAAAWPSLAAAERALVGLTAWPQWSGPAWPPSSLALLAGAALAAGLAGLRLLLSNGLVHLSEGEAHD